MAYDGRQAGEETIVAWQEASRRGRWTYDEAREAVLEHFANSTDYLKPAHITQHVKAKRQVPPPVREIEAPPKPPADPERIRTVIAALGKKLGWKQKSRADDPALTVTCPHCKAPPGRPCARQLGHGHRRGQWVPISGIHPSRAELADKENQ